MIGLAKVPVIPLKKGIYEMRSCHTQGAVCARFDDPNLVSHAGLVPLMRLAERAPLWRDRFRSLLDDVAATGTPFGVIRDNPQLPSDPIECLGTAERVEDCSPSREDVLKNTATIRDAETEVLAGFPDAPQLSTLDTICDERRCNLSDDSGSYLRYYDSGHLTREFTDSQTPELTALLSSILAQAR